MNLKDVSKSVDIREYRIHPAVQSYTKYERVYQSGDILLQNLNEIQTRSVKFIQECPILKLDNVIANLHTNKTQRFHKPVVEVTVIPRYRTAHASKQKYKKIRNTVSNHLLPNLNFYCNKESTKQKVYKLKTSESDIIYSRHVTKEYEDVSLDLLSMEKNRRKSFRSSQIKDDNGDCSCKKQEDCKLNTINSKKDRVTIVGQLGLTHDERYVLKCAATVNDKPVSTNLSHVSRKSERSNLNENFTYSKTTQATQVNFNFSNNIPKKNYKNQIVQCNCIENEIEIKTARSVILKESKSPLVVISVYPRQDEMGTDHSPVKIIQHTFLHEKQKDKIETKKNVNEKTLQNNTSARPSNRSSSPENLTKDIYARRTEDKKLLTTSKRHSPSRPINVNKPENKANDLKKASQNIKTFRTSKQENVNNKSKTDVEIVKKALVSNFLKSFERKDSNPSKSKFIAPKDDASKVTVNIEGDNENYDVTLERNEYKTGIFVSKTKKPKQIIKRKCKSDDEANVCGMEKFVMLDNRVQAGPSTLQSKLNVRDSLEIKHRQRRRSSNLKTENNAPKNVNKSDASNLERIKHFRGDNCSLTDPNDRDREIRELLGVVWNNRKSKIFGDVAECNRNYIKTCSKSLMTELSISNVFQNFKEGAKEKLQNEKEIVKNNTLIKDFLVINKASLNLHDMKPSIAPKNCVLNRNFQVFLELGQCNNTRPISLSRKQYNKVKKTVELSLSKKYSFERNYKKFRNYSIVSIGDVKLKSKLRPVHFDREVQTDRMEMKKIVKDIKEHTQNPDDDRYRKAESSMDMRYADLIENKFFHSTPAIDKECFSRSSIKPSTSIHTIFKGHRRSVTPNLGTSEFTLESIRTDGHNSVMPSFASDSNVKKPFLRRLMSCLVLRPNQNPAFKRTSPPKGTLCTKNSSDSYYINTSLCAFEMTSSLYDTSASFYTNHAIFSKHKIKRGFFTSVREFLTSRRA